MLLEDLMRLTVFYQNAAFKWLQIVRANKKNWKIRYSVLSFKMFDVVILFCHI